MADRPRSPILEHGFRQVGDAELDATVAEFAASISSPSPWHTMRAVREVVAGTSAALAPPAATIEQFTTTGPGWPTWVQADALRRGRLVFRDNGLVVVNVMFNGSMPLEFSASGGVRAFHRATSMHRDDAIARRRLAETAMFLTTVMGYLADQPAEHDAFSSLQPGAAGYRAARAVRIYHSAVRAHIAASKPPWDTEAWGVPVNLEDIYGTLLASSIFVTDGLRKLGVVLDDSQVDDYLHRWSLVGWLLAPALEPLLPLDQTVAREHAEQLFAANRGRTAEGVELIEILLEQLDDASPKLMRRFGPALMHQLLPPGTPEVLGIPPAGWRGLAVGAHTRLLKALPPAARIRLARRLSRGVGRRHILDFIEAGSSGKPSTWDLGVLRDQWRLD